MHARRLHYRGLRLDGPIEQFHRAVDRLRWDTLPAPLDHQPPTTLPTRRRRQDPVDGQAALLEALCTSTCT